MHRKAFTLIELLIVISIIGILIAVSVATWISVAQRGRDSTRKSDLARIKQALQQEYSDTRLYPSFDSTQGVIYAAGWQLTTDVACNHSNSAIRLTTKYLAEVPRDPKDALTYSSLSCADLIHTQKDRYLYITAPTDASGPKTNATGFALMATLEQNSTDFITDALNPLKSSGTVFGDWYKNHENYSACDTCIGVNANYLLDNKNQ